MPKSISRRVCLGGLLASGASIGKAFGSPPQRIAALEWASAETMLALGVTPLAIASPFAGAQQEFVQQSALSGVDKVGNLFEPNLEYLQWLKPDLIVAAYWQKAQYSSLDRIAPTYVFDLREPTPNLLQNARSFTRQFGEKLGREAEAQRFLNACEAEFDRLRSRLRQIDMRPILLGTLDASGRYLSFYCRGCLFNDLMERLGVPNAWHGPATPWGTVLQGVEILTRFPDTTFLYLDNKPFSTVARQRLSSSTLWNALASVQRGRVRALPFTWPFGALPSAQKFANSLVDALKSETAP